MESENQMKSLNTGLRSEANESAGDATVPPSNSMGAARLGLWVLGIGLGGFLLWAGLAPLDEGVPTHGMVTLDTKSKMVQHLSGGIVSAVLVREGDLVTEGQPLLELDSGVSNANFEAVRQRYLGLRAMQGRLLAEKDGAASIMFHADLVAEKGDPLIASQMATQQDLLRARRNAQTAELSAMDESIRGQQSMIDAYKAVLVSRMNQKKLIEQELAQTRPLVADGYAPRNRLLELERSVADMQAMASDLNGQILRAGQAVAELRQRKVARQQDYRKEVETMLADVTREVQGDAQKMVAVTADLTRTQIRAPAAGQVVGLVVQSVGAVVQPGQKLMMVVPSDEPLMLETRIEPHLIDKVHAGLVTDIRFSTFAHSPQLVVQGKVESISRDLLVDQPTGAGYYLARVAVTPEGMKTLGQRRMQPGMPADVIIKTGERTMLKYLMSPLLKRLAASLKEE